MAEIAGIVLAAGFGSRMPGREKVLLEFRGETLLERSVRITVEAGLQQTFCVVPEHLVAEAHHLLAQWPCTIIGNPNPEKGAAYSLSLGVRRLENTVDGLVVLLADMPHVSSTHVSALISAADPEKGVCVVSYDGEHTSPPAFFSRDVFSSLKEASGDNPGRQVVARLPREAIARVTVDPAALIDIDTPEQYASLLADRAPSGGVSVGLVRK